MDVAYDGQFGIPISFTFTPTTGTAFGTAQAQAQEYTGADHKVDTNKFVPISGANSGFEQIVLGVVRSQVIMIKATYGSTEHAAAQVCIAARIGGVLVVTYGPGPGETVGATDTYAKAFLTGVKPSAITAESLRTDELEFTVSLPSTFVAGH